MAPRKIPTRSDPNPELIEPVDDFEKFLRKARKEASPGTFFLERSLSFPEYEILDLGEFSFDEIFEHSLFRTKLESDLQSTLFDQKRF